MRQEAPIMKSGAYHDIVKAWVPKEQLLKPGKLKD
jgi:HD-GYP domain-containing protein (c-di-GMP phosphodiesterase class II)